LDDSIALGRGLQSRWLCTLESLGIVRDFRYQWLERLLATRGVQKPEQAADRLLSSWVEVAR